MSDKQDERDTYIIPPNFIENGTLFGGMFKVRNAIEAAVLAIVVGIPVFHLGLPLTTRIIILCLTSLPLALLALIGISGESLSSFAFILLKYLKNRRVVGVKEETVQEEQAAPKKKRRPAKERRAKKEDFPAEFDEVKEKSPRREKSPGKCKAGEKKEIPNRYLNPVAEYIPVNKIENGVIYTKDHRYVKIVEVLPINFLLRSTREQRSIIYSFISFLKISPVKMQFKVITKRADINRHLQTVEREMEQETDEKCRLLQRDYTKLIRKIGSREAITRRFFIVFEYEPWNGRRGEDENEAVSFLQTAARTATNYLRQCGNEVLAWEDENEATTDVLYSLLNRRSSTEKSLQEHVREVIGKYVAVRGPEAVDDIPVTEFFAPEKINFMHGRYVQVDDVYQAYLLVPSAGYKPEVCAGWLSLLVNAGEGIDLDLFLQRQPKERIVQKLGQQLRINRSKIKETSDTNSDFDDLDGAIRSGYFLKEGLSNNEDFYYANILITITADTLQELEWREAEMKKLLISQDMDVVTCSFREEQAFLSALPLISLEKKLYERSKRNVLTMGAASCYPFTSFELCDDNGILLGVNKHNNSLIIVDIFNSRTYKNANMAILGTSGAGKTFTLQLMALRMRRKNIQTFIIAPLKGHEFHRACVNIGGEFIQISPASKNCINIMEIRRVDRSTSELLDGPVLDKSELAAKIQRLHIFFSLLIPDMSHEEKQLLDDSMIRTYALKGITHNNESLGDPERPGYYREMPVLGDLHEILKKNPDTKRLANILNRLVNGSASTFNQQTNVNLENKYTVLDISELTGDLLTVGMFVALDYVWDKAKEDRTVEKAIFLDELWQLIGASSNRLAAEYVLEIFKIIRGYGGSAICATQDLNDFFSLDDGKYGKGIINNSKTKIILNLEDEEAQRVQEILHLSEAEVMEVTHFERGNGLISTNNNNITVEFKASDLEKELITTDRRELQELVERKKAQQAV
ncbi:VirB4 family type IV secretion system protein [Caproicibacter sp. BJN0012]|uniref:VirB4 family type IV secretion system protein n=1 Tax=Caproicibacter sp. BJN0012 TaxID=3110227 RepID=UPI002E117358